MTSTPASGNLSRSINAGVQRAGTPAALPTTPPFSTCSASSPELHTEPTIETTMLTWQPTRLLPTSVKSGTAKLLDQLRREEWSSRASLLAASGVQPESLSSLITELRKRGYRILCQRSNYKLLSEPEPKEPCGWQKIYSMFTANPGTLITTETLQQVSGLKGGTVNVVIHYLRKHGLRIGNIHGKGYILYV